jgi:hypothetical protein
MKLEILSIRIEIVYRLAKFTTRLATWFCDKHSELFNEFEQEIKGEING